MSVNAEDPTFEIDFRQIRSFTNELILGWLNDKGQKYVSQWNELRLIGLEAADAALLNVMMPYFAQCKNVSEILITDASEETAAQVLDVIALFSTSCREVKIRRCDFSDRDCASLCALLSSFPHIRRFDLCAGGDAGILTAHAMATMMREKKTLRAVSPNALHLDNDCYAVLFSGLVDSPHVESFESLVSLCTLEYDARLPALITKLFLSGTTLSRFVFGQFHCTDDECGPLFAALAENKTLIELSLIFRDTMTQKRADGIALVLASNPNLKSVAFGQTTLYEEGKEFFRQKRLREESMKESAIEIEQKGNEENEKGNEENERESDSSRDCCSCSCSDAAAFERLRDYEERENRRLKKIEQVLQAWETADRVDLSAIEKSFAKNTKLVYNGFLSEKVCAITEPRWRKK